MPTLETMEKKAIKQCNECCVVINKPKGIGHEEWNNKKFCSRKCYHLNRKKKITKQCQYCKQIFCKKRRIGFCSRKCLFLSKRIRVQKNCLVCFKSFEVKKSHDKYSKYCSRFCAAEHYKKRFLGRDNPNWRGGISNDLRAYNLKRQSLEKNALYNHTTQEWEDLKKKFGFTCLVCGKKEPKIKLTKDHMISLYDGGENSIKNIQPLCRSCNSSKNKKSMKILISPSEQQIQRQILDYLILKGYYCYKNNNVGIYNKKTGKYIPAQTKGIADITTIKNGKCFQIEVKKPGGIQSEYQKEFQRNWEANGGVYILGGIDEVIKYL